MELPTLRVLRTPPCNKRSCRALGAAFQAIAAEVVFTSEVHCARRGLDKNIVSTTAPERAVLSVMSLGVALRTDESGASEAAETFIFLASI